MDPLLSGVSSASSSPSSLLWEVTSRVHAETGFWGPVDAIHQFCEPHYSTSFYFAEFWNAVSSLIYTALAWILYRKVLRSPMPGKPWLYSVCAWLAVIGIGSFLFHATMRRSCQLLDEGPMVGLIGTSILYKMDLHPWTRHNPRFFQIFFSILNLAVVSIYLYFDQYELFVHGFTMLVGIDIILGYAWNPGMCVYREISLATVLLGKAIWEVENRACATHPEVWPLHVVWHMLSAASAYYGVLYGISIFQDTNVKKYI